MGFHFSFLHGIYNVLANTDRYLKYSKGKTILGLEVFRIQIKPKEYNMLGKINLNVSQVLCLFVFL